MHQCESSLHILSTFPTLLQTLPGSDTEHHVESYPALGKISSNPVRHSVLHTAPQHQAFQVHSMILLNRCSIVSYTPAAACQDNTPGTYSPIPVIPLLLCNSIVRGFPSRTTSTFTGLPHPASLSVTPLVHPHQGTLVSCRSS